MIPSYEAKEGERYGWIEVSYAFIEHVLRDGSRLPAVDVSEGLPPNARVVMVLPSFEGAKLCRVLIEGIPPGEHLAPLLTTTSAAVEEGDGVDVPVACLLLEWPREPGDDDAASPSTPADSDDRQSRPPDRDEQG